MEELLEILSGLHPEVDFETEEHLIDNVILDSFDIVTLISEIQDVFDRDNFVKITKLNAILRLSASMDKSHQQKFKDISVNLDNNTLTVTGKTLYDITLEQGMFKLNSDFFEELYGIKPILKQKKEF